MVLEAFGAAADAGPSWVRLVLGWVAIVHALLCLRVIVQRVWRYWTVREAAHPERVPTAAMIAYGVLTANMGRVLLNRLPESPPLVWWAIIAYSVALIAGSFAFAQIIVLTRRAKHHH